MEGCLPLAESGRSVFLRKERRDFAPSGPGKLLAPQAGGAESAWRIKEADIPEIVDYVFKFHGYQIENNPRYVSQKDLERIVRAAL